MNKTEMDKSIAIDKAKAVIASCETQKQLTTSLQYIYNFYQLFKDLDSHQRLMELFVDKRLEIFHTNRKK